MFKAFTCFALLAGPVPVIHIGKVSHIGNKHHNLTSQSLDSGSRRQNYIDPTYIPIFTTLSLRLPELGLQNAMQYCE
jgi:hypothetical protein